MAVLYFLHAGDKNHNLAFIRGVRIRFAVRIRLFAPFGMRAPEEQHAFVFASFR